MYLFDNYKNEVENISVYKIRLNLSKLLGIKLKDILIN